MTTTFVRTRRRRGEAIVSWSRRMMTAALFLLVAINMSVVPVDSFRPSPKRFHNVGATNSLLNQKLQSGEQQQRRRRCDVADWTTTTTSTTTGLNMFMGSDGGILGIGTPELFTILLVGYFVLGPSDLYKLTKEIGKFIQNIRTLSTDLTKTFENNMENQLQLEELRKAQRELTDAFSFRRSINVDRESEAFATNAASPREGVVAAPSVGTPAAGTTPAASASAVDGAVEGAAAAATAAAPPPTKKKIRRRKKVVQPDPSSPSDIPDLQMPPIPSSPVGMETTGPSLSTTTTTTTGPGTINKRSVAEDPFVTGTVPPEYTKSEQDEIDREFDKYVGTAGPSPPMEAGAGGTNSWYSDAGAAVNDGGNNNAAGGNVGVGVPTRQEQSRFQQQLSGTWNDQVLANEDKLAPMSKVMEMLASLEEEKIAATKRLEDEFRQRAEIEERYYREQRDLLERTAANVQMGAYKFEDAGTTAGGDGGNAAATAPASSSSTGTGGDDDNKRNRKSGSSYMI